MRFATEEYTCTDLKKRFIHLTNFSVNKKSDKFKSNKGADNEDEEGWDGQESSKWSFGALKKAYEEKGINYEFVFAQIKDVIVKTLIAVEPHIVGNIEKCPNKNRFSCFELFGFDILIDANLKPWLLEVNVLPSLSSSSPFDKTIKTMLICDVMNLIGIRGYDKKKVKEMTGKVRQDERSMTMEEIEKIGKFTGEENLTMDDINILADHEDEFSRKGNFSRIFPLPANIDYYAKLFEHKRYNNLLLWAYIRAGQAG